MLRSARVERPAGLRLAAATISACAACSSSSSAPVHGCVSLLACRAAPAASSGCLQIDDGDRLRPRSAGCGAQLQRQAFGEVARAHAGRLQALQQAQRALQPSTSSSLAAPRVVAGRPQALGDLLERVGEVAVLVERLDQHVHGRRVLVGAGAGRAAGRAGDPAGDRRRRAALGGIELVVAVDGARLAGRLADAIEVRRARCRSPSPRARWCRTRRRRSTGAVARRLEAGLGGAARLALADGSARVSRSAPIGSNTGAASSSASRNGFCSSICSTSWCSSSVESCSRRIDCCSCGVSARCCDRRTCSHGFMARSAAYIRKCSPR